MAAAPASGGLTVRHLVKRHSAVEAVGGIDLDIRRGEFLTLLGPPGSGKTTLPMLIAGYQEATSGDILLDGASNTGKPAEERNFGMVFQGYALFPHKTMIAQPIACVRNQLGVLTGMVCCMIPCAVLQVLTAMRAIDGRVLRASRNLGASLAQTVWRVCLPLTGPGVIAGAFLVFILSLGFYVTAASMGGGKVLMIAGCIWVQIVVTRKWGTAAMLAVPMPGSALGLMYVLQCFMKLSGTPGGGRT